MLWAMKWLTNHPRLKQILMILLLLLLLPLAPELLIILDVVGLETTLLFFFLYSNQLLQEFTGRISFLYYTAESRIQAKQEFLPTGTAGFSISVLASTATLFLTGSLTLALFTWGPALLAAS